MAVAKANRWFGAVLFALAVILQGSALLRSRTALLQPKVSNVVAVSPASEKTVVLPTSFTIRPNHTFAWYKGGSALETFHSFVPIWEGYQVVYKVTTKDTSLSSGRSQNIETMQLSSTFERMEKSRRTLGDNVLLFNKKKHGTHKRKQSGLSDPRAFLWNNSTYALVWRHTKRDHDIFLFNLFTGEERLLNDCVHGYRGKNWVPLVYHEQLYVVHRLSPQLRWFKYDIHSGCPAPQNMTNDDDVVDDIDEWRGGSSFVPFGPTSMISMGHRTVDSQTHIPYLIHVDMNEDSGTPSSDKVAIRQLKAQEGWTGILDPTSLWWGEEGKLWMGTVRTSGSWKKCYFKDRKDCVFNMTIYEVALEYS